MPPRVAGGVVLNCLVLAAVAGCRVQHVPPPTADSAATLLDSTRSDRVTAHFLGLCTAKYSATDLAAAKAWYTQATGVEPYFDEPFYVGFNVGGFELGITPADAAPAMRAEAGIAYWGVNDALATWQRLVAMGATAHEPIQDVGEGILIGSLHDPFGNVLGIIQNPHFQQ
jgi:predicted enzyme related to lactoylglutathione lyase